LYRSLFGLWIMLNLSLKHRCVARQSTFSRDRAETVAEITDLANLDAKRFFEETHVTGVKPIFACSEWRRLGMWSGAFTRKWCRQTIRSAALD
jgi:hypothetical protein